VRDGNLPWDLNDINGFMLQSMKMAMATLSFISQSMKMMTATLFFYLNEHPLEHGNGMFFSFWT